MTIRPLLLYSFLTGKTIWNPCSKLYFGILQNKVQKSVVQTLPTHFIHVSFLAIYPPLV